MVNCLPHSLSLAFALVFLELELYRASRRSFPPPRRTASQKRPKTKKKMSNRRNENHNTHRHSSPRSRRTQAGTRGPSLRRPPNSLFVPRPRPRPLLPHPPCPPHIPDPPQTRSASSAPACPSTLFSVLSSHAHAAKSPMTFAFTRRSFPLGSPSPHNSASSSRLPTKARPVVRPMGTRSSRRVARGRATHGCGRADTVLGAAFALPLYPASYPGWRSGHPTPRPLLPRWRRTHHPTIFQPEVLALGTCWNLQLSFCA
ncbi:hypothetical protein DFH09DRAFT_1362749 [Mycena vulgaris]|nr:hypothetical protein DFH09DRAFT_1362749 [Mycena vulgaris]